MIILTLFVVIVPVVITLLLFGIGIGTIFLEEELRKND